MTDDYTLTEIDPGAQPSVPTAAQIKGGIPVPPVKLVEVFESDQWEEFAEEWLSYYKSQGHYDSVRRFSGPGDRGLDLIGFTSPAGFSEAWDSYQCKHYDKPLRPEDVAVEIAKIIYHSFVKSPPFNQAQPLPRKHIFVAPRGCGITVARWFKDPARFKKEIREKWLNNGLPNIGKNISIKFEDEFLLYFEDFDFSIFGDKSTVELIEEHSHTVFHAPRFGGGLPARGSVTPPPAQPSAQESLYLRKLFDVYEEQLETPVGDRAHLAGRADLLGHYDRQRVLFYHAEALRNFARDRTPTGTFDSLKDDIFHGVIDVCEEKHDSGLARLRKAVTTAGTVDVSGNALVSVTLVADKQGVCHHLANDDRLTWVKDDD